MSDAGSPEGTTDVPPADQPPAPGGRHRRPPSRRSRWTAAAQVVAGLLAAAAGLGLGLTTWTVNHYTSGVARIADPFPSADSAAPAPRAGSTFLLVAVEQDASAAKGLIADAVQLVRFTGDRAHAEVVFFPMDAWLPDRGTTPAAAFAAGGAPELIGDLEATTGVRVDHYAQVDFDGFRTITDALGGVDLDNPEPYSDRGHDFPVGRQHLDGQAAVAYVRDADEAAKATSAARQQRLIQALFDRLSQQGALSDFGTLTATVHKLAAALSVDDTLANTDLVQLAWNLRGVERPDFVAAPVSGTGTEGGQPVRYLDDARAANLWEYLREDSLQAHLAQFG